MRQLKALLIIGLAMCGLRASAQNIEHQIVASQFGQFQVPTVGQGFSFPPASCQIAAGGKNFPAFKTGVPIKVVDANPAQIEIDTPVAVNLNNNNCSVSMTTTYSHISFYLTSGTGGLQEALNAGQVTGGANTVILDQQWYSQVAPGNPATVISSVQGTTALGLVDVTTPPYTYYQWNGSAYAQVTPGSGPPTGTAGGTLAGTYPNPSLGTVNVSQIVGAAPSASPTLTGTPLSVTLPITNNNTEIATTAAVDAYAAPLVSPALTGTPTAPTKPLTDNNTEVATSASVNAGLLSYAPIANPSFTGVPTAPTAPTGTTGTQLATLDFVLANASGGIAPSAQYRLPQYSLSGATILGSSITTDSTGASLTVPGSFFTANQYTTQGTPNFVTGSSIYSYNQTEVGGCTPDTDYHAVQFTHNMTAAMTVCNHNSSGAGGNLPVGIFASSSSSVSGVDANAAQFYAFPAANGAQAITLNNVAQDVPGLTSGVILQDVENDNQPTNPPSAYSTGGGEANYLYNNYNNSGTYPFSGWDLVVRNLNGGSAFWQNGLKTETASLGSASVFLDVNPIGIATSGANYNCPVLLNAYESYWNGSSGVYEGWAMGCNVPSGANPGSDKFYLGHGPGTAPAGQTHTFEMQNGIQLQLDGSTSGSAVLSASATGGTLNLGSTNATVAANGALTVTSCTGCYTPGSTTPFTIAASASPVINLANGPLQTITLTSASTPTVTGITAGAHLMIQICEGATVYAWTWPAGIHGGICVASTCTPYPTQPNTCSMQTFNSYTGTTLVPENIGVVNVAP